MIILQDITYIHPNKDLLFSAINLTVNQHQKISLVGNNGSGKSTLLHLIAGNLIPSNGRLSTRSTPYCVPQHFGQYNKDTVAKALQIADKIQALQQILLGVVTEENLVLLEDDWTIEERSREALSYWGLHDIDLNQSMDTLSGGQKTRVFLAGIKIHQPEIVLLDEPSNHLDIQSRAILYDYIESTRDTLVVVSHDRILLNKIHTICELTKGGIKVYGGNYDFYMAQKGVESQALEDDLKNKEKALRKAKVVERETLERQQKLEARGKKKQEKAGIPTIMMNTLRNKAEKTSSKLKGVHTEKKEVLSQQLSQLRRELPSVDKMKIDFDDSNLHTGKIMVAGEAVNFGYGATMLWETALNFTIRSGERWVIRGINGSGKTSLIKMILGILVPTTGSLIRSEIQTIYIDQDYSLISNKLRVYEQMQAFNTGEWPEHEIKMRLNRFLFTTDDWDKPCIALSGGEKMRLLLCALTLSSQSPDLIVLDEPTNNLDIQNLEILTRAIQDYHGTLVVVSHDISFLNQIKIDHFLQL